MKSGVKSYRHDRCGAEAGQGTDRSRRKRDAFLAVPDVARLPNTAQANKHCWLIRRWEWCGRLATADHAGHPSPQTMCQSVIMRRTFYSTNGWQRTVRKPDDWWQDQRVLPEKDSPPCSVPMLSNCRKWEYTPTFVGFFRESGKMHMTPRMYTVAWKREEICDRNDVYSELRYDRNNWIPSI